MCRHNNTNMRGNCTTYSGYGLAMLNRLQSNLSGCHSTVSRVNLPNIFIEAALARLFSLACITFIRIISFIRIMYNYFNLLQPRNDLSPDICLPTHSRNSAHCYVLTFADLHLINLSRVSPGPTIRHIMSTYWPVHKNI